jgi:hypothetical protein
VSKAIKSVDTGPRIAHVSGGRIPRLGSTIMTLAQIKAAVEAGKTVHWANSGYRVVKDHLGQWFIVYDRTQYYIGLTHQNGRTMNGEPSQFFIAK